MGRRTINLTVDVGEVDVDINLRDIPTDDLATLPHIID